MPIQIQTDRLLLREMTQADFPALCQMLYDPVVMKAYEGAFTQAEAQAWLDRQISRYRKDGLGLWAVVLREARPTGTGAMPPRRPAHAAILPLTPLAPKRCIPSSAIPTPPAALWRCATACTASAAL